MADGLEGKIGTDGFDRGSITTRLADDSFAVDVAGQHSSSLRKEPKPVSKAQVISTLVKVCCVCTVFMVLEFIGGYLSRSIAVMSDALHLSIDIIGYIVQIISAHYASKPATSRFTFGYGRLEPIGALLNCLIIWVLTAHLCMEAYNRIVSSTHKVEKDVMVFTAFFAVCANLTMAGIVYGRQVFCAMLKYPFMSAAERDSFMLAEGQGDLNIRTVMAHINGDLVYSVGVWIASLIIQVNPDLEILDPLLTILFSFVVIHITFPVAKDSLLAISEASENPEEKDELTNKITKIEGISKIRGFRRWQLTGEQKCIAMHVVCKPGSDKEQVQLEVESFLEAENFHYTAVQLWSDEHKHQCKHQD